MCEVIFVVPLYLLGELMELEVVRVLEFGILNAGFGKMFIGKVFAASPT